MPTLRSGRTFETFPPLELLSTGRSFASAIQEALQLEEDEVLSCPTSPVSSDISSLCSDRLEVPNRTTKLHNAFVADPAHQPPVQIVPTPKGLGAAKRPTPGEATGDAQGAMSSSLPPRGKKRKRKRNASDRAAKKARRNRRRAEEQEELGPTGVRPPKHREVPRIIHADVIPISHFPVNSTGYTTNRITSIQPDEAWTLLRLRDISIEGVLAWDGM